MCHVLTIHVSGVVEMSINNQRNWMHDPAEADVIFRSILTLTLTCIRFILLLLLLSLHIHDLKWSFLEIWRKRDLEDVQRRRLPSSSCAKMFCTKLRRRLCAP